MAQRIKQGDTVLVTTGKDRGKTGRVMRVIKDKASGNIERVLVENVNRATKHTKPTQANPNGGKMQIDVPLHVSNVALVDPKTNKPTRVRFETRDGVKHRVAVKSGESLGTVNKTKKK